MTLYKAIDVERALVAFLQDDPDLEVLHNGRVSTEMPKDAVMPRLRISRIGGVPDADGWIDRPRIAIEAWGSSKEEAWELASTSLAVLQFRLPAAPLAEGVVTDVRADTGLAWAPDAETDLARYTFAVSLTAHPKQ
jgi:hypothetical protein